MNKAVGLINLIRPVNCLMMGFAVIVGASIGISDSSSTQIAPKLLMAFVTAFTLTGASMAINDYYDREIDMINEPNRPIPSGTVRPREGLILAAILTLLGFSAAFITNPSCLAVAIVSWIVSVAYVTKGKETGLPGNLLVGACIAIPLIYGSLTVSQSLTSNAVLFASLAFLSGTGREVTKGIVDIKGDETKKIRTIAVSFGSREAAYVSSAFHILAVVLSLFPIYLRLVSVWYIPLVAIADFGFVTSSIMLVLNSSRENARRIKNLLLIWMIAGLLAFVAGTIM